ncbi:MAG: CRISPR-associated protein Cas2 [Spirochaetales bacterium]|nr:CRISPR-associated protein Cas2 [Spirochaetales bacterium]
MFVSVVCGILDNDHKIAAFDCLKRYGFKEIFEGTFESTSINEKTLTRLKYDIDKVIDSYDKIRFYQYPVNDTLVISYLSEKKWKKLTLQT